MQYIIFLILFLFPLISPFFLSPSLNPVTRLHGKSSSKKTKKKPATSGGGGFGGALKKLKETTFGYTGTVTAYPQTPQSKIPSSLLPKSCVPSYASSSVPAVPPPTLPWVIERKTPEMTTKMERAGEVARQVLETAGGHIKEGVTTEEIDRIVHEEVRARGQKSATNNRRLTTIERAPPLVPQTNYTLPARTLHLLPHHSVP